jgi:hypothetical protein
MAQSGHDVGIPQCPLLGVKRTPTGSDPMSGFDPKADMRMAPASTAEFSTKMCNGMKPLECLL